MSVPRNRIQESIILPNGRGRDIKVCIIGGDELAMKAKGVADRVVTADELAAIADDEKEAKELAKEHDYFIAEAPMMPTIGKRLGSVLGPRGKMPRPIEPGEDPEPIVDNLKNSISVRTRDKTTFHAPVGTADMSVEELSENIDAVIKRVAQRLERRMLNIDSAYVKTTMGPSVRVV